MSVLSKSVVAFSASSVHFNSTCNSPAGSILSKFNAWLLIRITRLRDAAHSMIDLWLTSIAFEEVRIAGNDKELDGCGVFCISSAILIRFWPADVVVTLMAIAQFNCQIKFWSNNATFLLSLIRSFINWKLIASATSFMLFQLMLRLVTCWRCSASSRCISIWNFRASTLKLTGGKWVLFSVLYKNLFGCGFGSSALCFHCQIIEHTRQHRCLVSTLGGMSP